MPLLITPRARGESDPGYCALCDFAYVPGFAPDERAHRRMHAVMVHGVAARPLRSDQVLARTDALRVTLVTPAAPLAQRRRAEAAAVRAREDTPFDTAAYAAAEMEHPRRPRVVLGARAARIVALLVLREARWTCGVRWEDLDGSRVTPLEGVPDQRWAVALLWVLARARGQGLPERLLQAGAHALGTAVTDLAWDIPFTPAGLRVARRVSGPAVWLSW